MDDLQLITWSECALEPDHDILLGLNWGFVCPFGDLTFGWFKVDARFGTVPDETVFTRMRGKVTDFEFSPVKQERKLTENSYLLWF